MTFGDEVRKAHLGRKDLEALGLTAEEAGSLVPDGEQWKSVAAVEPWPWPSLLLALVLVLAVASLVPPRPPLNLSPPLGTNLVCCTATTLSLMIAPSCGRRG